MFFSNDILLSKKKGSLAIIWLAATLGPKSHAKKLSRRDYAAVNVVETCAYLINPPEPLALRLSSNLMYGLTKVYNQQCQIYYVDVQHFWNKIQGYDSLRNRIKGKGNVVKDKHASGKKSGQAIEKGRLLEEQEEGNHRQTKIEPWMTPEMGRRLSEELDQKLASIQKPESHRKISMTSSVGAGSRRDSFSSFGLTDPGGLDGEGGGFGMDDDFMNDIIRDSLTHIGKDTGSNYGYTGMLLDEDASLLLGGAASSGSLSLSQIGSAADDDYIDVSAQPDGTVPNTSPPNAKRRRSPTHSRHLPKHGSYLKLDNVIALTAEEMSHLIKNPASLLLKRSPLIPDIKISQQSMLNQQLNVLDAFYQDLLHHDPLLLRAEQSLIVSSSSFSGAAIGLGAGFDDGEAYVEWELNQHTPNQQEPDKDENITPIKPSRKRNRFDRYIGDKEEEGKDGFEVGDIVQEAVSNTFSNSFLSRSPLSPNIANERDVLEFEKKIFRTMQALKSSSVKWKQVVSPAAVNRSIAAQSFLNLLELASHNRFQVQQTKPFQQILITAVAH